MADDETTDTETTDDTQTDDTASSDADDEYDERDLETTEGTYTWVAIDDDLYLFPEDWFDAFHAARAQVDDAGWLAWVNDQTEVEYAPGAAARIGLPRDGLGSVHLVGGDVAAFHEADLADTALNDEDIVGEMRGDDSWDGKCVWVTIAGTAYVMDDHDGTTLEMLRSIRGKVRDVAEWKSRVESYSGWGYSTAAQLGLPDTEMGVITFQNGAIVTWSMVGAVSGDVDWGAIKALNIAELNGLVAERQAGPDRTTTARMTGSVLLLGEGHSLKAMAELGESPFVGTLTFVPHRTSENELVFAGAAFDEEEVKPLIDDLLRDARCTYPWRDRSRVKVRVT